MREIEGSTNRRTGFPTRPEGLAADLVEGRTEEAPAQTTMALGARTAARLLEVEERTK
jgi:hypothetical protein